MELRRLGAGDPEVSSLGLGCMGMSGMYGPMDRAESVATIRDTGDFHGMDRPTWLA
jgi:aryl-alcohol dehydrogenase-like predicted oxidoreductase